MPTSTVEIRTADGVANAFLAQPEEPSGPAVLFLMDAYGLRPTLEAMVSRIAADGSVVLAPNLFYRAGPSPLPPMPNDANIDERMRFFEHARPLMQQLTHEALASDGEAYLAYLRELDPGVPTVAVGYCMGVRCGWRIATSRPGSVAALAGFHGGGLVTDDPDSPHLVAAALKSDVYLAFADEDPSMTAEQISTLESALKAAEVSYRLETYKGAAHGYTMKDSHAYNDAASERHFTEVQAVLAHAGRHS
jgi:carboxymethylenebutenolidase